MYIRASTINFRRYLSLCVYIVFVVSAGLTEELEEAITSAIRKEPVFSSKREYGSCVYCVLLAVYFFLASIDISSLRLIKDQLPEHIGYGFINLTLAILKIKTGYVSSTSPSSTPQASHTHPPLSTDTTTTSIAQPQVS